MSEFNRKTAEKIASTWREGDTASNVESITNLLDATYGKQPVTSEDLRDVLGEAIHVGFRKGMDNWESSAIWNMLRTMDRDDWGGYVHFVASILSTTLSLPKPSEDSAQ